MAPFGASRAGLMSVAADDIPDSAIYRYPFAERSDDTLVEEIQGENGTAVELTNVTGNWTENHAERGDGTNYGSLVAFSETEFSGPFSLEFSFESTDDSDKRIGGVKEGSQRIVLRIREGNLAIQTSDIDNESIIVETTESFATGSQKHIVIGWDDFVDADTYDIYVDTVENSNVAFDQSPSAGNLTDYTEPFFTHAKNDDGSKLDGIDADIGFWQFHDERLSQSQVDDLYNSLPWT